MRRKKSDNFNLAWVFIGTKMGMETHSEKNGIKFKRKNAPLV